MTQNSRPNRAVKAWQIAREAGCWGLIHQLVPGWMPTLHSWLPSGFDNMEEVTEWLALRSGYDVYSFDIFDTLLRRRVDPPELIKGLVAEHISGLLVEVGIDMQPGEVLLQRNKAEEILRQEATSRGKDAQCYLDDVIDDTLKVLKAEGVLDSQKIIKYEIDLEKKGTELMPGVMAVLEYLKSLDKRVIGISETYLSSDQISAILEHHGLTRYIDGLYVSSDLGKSKATGNLFQHILENEGSDIVHVGDQYTLDSRIPMMLGIRALWFHSRSEQKRKKRLRNLLKGKNKMNYVNAVVGGVDEDRSGLYRIGYEVLGPALTVFAHNVAEQARKDNVEALFFVARDGYALKKIYEILQRNMYADFLLPPAKYICLSRFPVRSASLHRFTNVEVGMSMTRFLKKDVSLADVLSSYGLIPEHFAGIAKRYEVDMGSTICEPMHDGNLHELLESDEFQDAVKIRSDEARRLLRGYLVSIGFVGKRKVALVDANVEGLTQSLLERAFYNDRDFPALQGYYFSVVNANSDKVNIDLTSSKFNGIVSDWRRDPKGEHDPFSRFGVIIELFSHPNHGVTVAYKRVNSKTMPVFRKTPQESLYHLTSQGLQGILSYARDYGMYYTLHKYKYEELLQPLKGNIKQWMALPPKRDAEALRGLFLTSDWPKESNTDIVRQVTLKDIITLTGLLHRVSSSLYPQGTLALSPLPRLSRLIFKAATYGYGGFGTISRMLRARHINNARVS
jgi:FMN phosphatase YigB (HAD superfamily)